jgi:hypothetical protein
MINEDRVKNDTKADLNDIDVVLGFIGKVPNKPAFLQFKRPV